MREEIVIPIAFFLTVIIVVIVVPIVRATVRRWDRTPLPTGLTPELERRLDRLEAMVETVSVEVERLSEGQRFTTRLLSERAPQFMVPHDPAAAPVRGTHTEVTDA
ncbi:MAG: hypothetical protein H7099_00700 [Gemmatimonadaceae bacterium]|nr:hypothetical protein [Gemmatimonadaceae bacterium]